MPKLLHFLFKRRPKARVNPDFGPATPEQVASLLRWLRDGRL